MPDQTTPDSTLPVGDPGLPLLIAANKALQDDPNFRATVRQMHAEKFPLVKMVEALGLDDDLTPAVRQILDNLKPHVVDGIRAATLDMLDRADNSMPMDCNVTESHVNDGAPVHIEVRHEHGRRTIHVRPSTTKP